MSTKDPMHLYKRVSLELVNAWPGEVYLRLEPFGDGPAVMFRVMPGDMVSISKLAENRNGEVIIVEPIPTEDDITGAGIP